MSVGRERKKFETDVRSRLDSLPKDVFEDHEHNVLNSLTNQISNHTIMMQKCFAAQEGIFNDQFKAAYQDESLHISNELQPIINNGEISKYLIYNYYAKF